MTTADETGVPVLVDVRISDDSRGCCITSGKPSTSSRAGAQTAHSINTSAINTAVSAQPYTYCKRGFSEAVIAAAQHAANAASVAVSGSSLQPRKQQQQQGQEGSAQAATDSKTPPAVTAADANAGPVPCSAAWTAAPRELLSRSSGDVKWRAICPPPSGDRVGPFGSADIIVVGWLMQGRAPKGVPAAEARRVAADPGSLQLCTIEAKSYNAQRLPGTQITNDSAGSMIQHACGKLGYAHEAQTIQQSEQSQCCADPTVALECCKLPLCAQFMRHTHFVAGAPYAGAKFYKPLSVLLPAVPLGLTYSPVTKADLARGYPPTGWNTALC